MLKYLFMQITQNNIAYKILTISLDSRDKTCARKTVIADSTVTNKIASFLFFDVDMEMVKLQIVSNISCYYSLAVLHYFLGLSFQMEFGITLSLIFMEIRAHSFKLFKSIHHFSYISTVYIYILEVH